MAETVSPTRRLHERLLLAAAAIQGETSIGPVPGHSELDAFSAAEGIDRMALIGAFTEGERRGWMELIKVMGPWHWQVTYPGLEVADRMRAEDAAERAELEIKRKHGADRPTAPETETRLAAEFFWDLFIAHASEDKPSFADDLAAVLNGAADDGTPDVAFVPFSDALPAYNALHCVIGGKER